MRLAKHLLLLLLLLGLLNDGRRLPDDRALNNFGELRSRGTYLDLAGGDRGHRNDGSSAWTGRGFGRTRAIVANAGHVRGILWHLLLRGDGDRRLWNLRILRFGND